MLDEAMNRRELEERIVRVLDTCPDAERFIPDDFAARVAARVPARRAVRLTPTHYGRNVMFAGMVALLAVLAVVTMGRPDRSAAGLVLESCLCAQVIASAVWLSLRQWSLR